MRRYVALIQVMTVDQDRQFVQFLESEGFGFWHWIDGSWLITDSKDGERVSTKVREEIGRIAKGNHCLIFEIDGVKGWAGFGPSTTDNNMFEWIRSDWKVSKPPSAS